MALRRTILTTNRLFRCCSNNNVTNVTCHHRFLSSSSSSAPPPANPFKQTKPKESQEFVTPSGRLRKWIGERLVRFIEGYEEILKKFPRVYKVYRIFSVGTKELLQDSVTYLNVNRDLLFGREVHSLSHRELVIHYETPKALAKVGPTLLISALPFANYVVFPIAYAFPKRFLSHHFWTLDQRVNFQLQDSIGRLKYYKPVFRHLQDKQVLVHDITFKKRWTNILRTLGSGLHPTVEDIEQVITIFSNSPYSLESLTVKHLSDLCRVHGLRSSLLLYGRKYRLIKHAAIIKEMDLAIDREGGSSSLSLIDLRKACAFRGLNPVNTSSDELIRWLSMWLRVSSFCHDTKSFSLLLHSPILLSYNHPSNWRLIY